LPLEEKVCIGRRHNQADRPADAAMRKPQRLRHLRGGWDHHGGGTADGLLKIVEGRRDLEERSDYLREASE